MEDAKTLLKKYAAGECSPEEKARVESWYLQQQQEVGIQLPESEKFADMDEIRARLLTEIKSKPVRTLWPRIAAAASIIIAFGLTLYFLLPTKKVNNLTAQKIDVVLPGSNKAYLVLGNGQRISLTDAKNGTIANQAGKSIQKTANGTVVYDNGHTNHNSEEIVYNTIETPRGGQYQVVLPDGSHVWLNAASSLKYPAQFTGNDRQVKLTGEAYFEVAKDKTHPFVVSTTDQTVTVLGTHFNINSYSDEPNTKTTLLEGSVRVNEAIIKPGEQSILTNHNIQIKTTDVEEAVAWKNGLFVFQQENIESVMRKIARWYDVEVVYDQSISDKTFTGTIGRFGDISKILHKITYTSGVHFKVEGRRITVSK